MDDATMTDVVRRLTRGGLSDHTIAALLDLPLGDVRDIASAVSIRGDADVTIDDVNKAMRALALKAIEEMFVLIDESAPPIKQRILTGMFSKMIGMMTEDDKTGTDELRQEMLGMFAGMRQSGGAPAKQTQNDDLMEEDTE